MMDLQKVERDEVIQSHVLFQPRASLVVTFEFRKKCITDLRSSITFHTHTHDLKKLEDAQNMLL